MRLQDYVDVIRKRWWLIGLAGLVAAVSAYGISKLQTPVYRSQAVYVATVNRADSGVYMFLGQQLNGIIRQVRNRDTFTAISQQLQIDVPPERLLSDVRMQAQPTDLTITIEADSPNVEDPPRLINAVGNALIARVAENNRLAEGQDRVNITREEPHPVFQAKPNTRINTLAGAILGLVLGLLLAFILEYLDDTIKTSEDVERFAGLTTLGLIPSGAAQPARRRVRTQQPAAVSRFIDRK
jgi:capsular polysaccharide biosynthesis protein